MSAPQRSQAPQAGNRAITLATWITLARIAGLVPFAAAYGLSWQVLAAILFAAAALTDWLDGYVARSRGEVSALGAALDPIADKLLTIAALILLCASGAIHGVHLIAALAIGLREVLVSGLREAVATRNVTLPVTFAAKVKTTVQFVGFLLLILADPAPGGLLHGVGLLVLWVAAALTVWTGYQYTDAAVRALTRPSGS